MASRRARISEGRGNITVRSVLERDLNDASNDVREKVAGAIRNVPPTLPPPVITKVDPDADPVMSLTAGDGRIADGAGSAFYAILSFLQFCR